jgi:hypothetical protein
MYSRIAQIATLLLIGLCVGAMLAQKPTPQPPTIPDAVQAKFWKAQVQVKNAQAALQAAEQQVQEAVVEIQKACGADFQPQMNHVGDPVCAAKPKPPAK